MKNIRKLLLVAITSFMLVISSVAVASESANDLDLLFGSSATQSMKLASLSEQEMRETEGARWQFIAAGTLYGGITYVSRQISSGAPISVPDLAMEAAGGAATTAIALRQPSKIVRAVIAGVYFGLVDRFR